MSNKKKIDTKVIPTNGGSNNRVKHPIHITPDESRFVFSSVSTTEGAPLTTRPPKPTGDTGKKDK